MKNWHILDPDQVKLMNKHYTPGRSGKKIEMVVIHHNAGVLSIDQIWQVWQTRAASAHYQVQSDGKIGQLVWDRDTAWHAANQDINQRSIGIEVSNSAGAAQDWPITDTAIREAARLTAAVCRYYKLGRPQAGKNVRFHREFTSTSCPYHLAPGGKYHQRLMQEAQRFYDELAGKNHPAASTQASAPERYWPLPKDKIKITSRFGGRPNPFTGKPDYHSGTDFGAPDGTPFYACQAGTVKYIGPARGYGHWIVIDSSDAEGAGCVEYGHMWNAFATGLKVGDKVKAGQLIGYVGSNGQSTGPHLHVTVWRRGYGGERIDPETWLAGAAYPGGGASVKQQKIDTPKGREPMSSTRVILGGESAAALHDTKLAAQAVEKATRQLTRDVTLIADQLLGWPKNDKGEYLISGWDFDTIVESAERKIEQGKGITLVEQVALLQKQNKLLGEAIKQANESQQYLIEAVKAGVK